MVKFKLRKCVWELTLNCCFSCKYCGSRGGKARENELTTEECLDVAAQLADLGCRRVSLIGGEVFMRKDWDQIVEALRKSGIRVSIITNGYVLNEDILIKLRRLDIESVAVSVDGSGEIHDRYRQQGSYQRAMECIERLTGAGIRVSVISTLNAENALELEALYQTLKTKPIKAWQLQACSPMGNAAKEGVDHRFDPSYVTGFVLEKIKEAPFMVGVADNIGYFGEGECQIRGNKNGTTPFHGCSAGLTGIGIDSVGNVRGCESMYDENFIEGNLREKTLREIWEDPNAFAYNRKFTKELLTGACRECEFGMICAGGCRSYNYFTTGKLYEAMRCVKEEVRDCVCQTDIR